MVIDSASNTQVTLTFDAVQAQIMKAVLCLFCWHSTEDPPLIISAFLKEHSYNLCPQDVVDLMAQIVVTMGRVNLDGHNFDPKVIPAVIAKLGLDGTPPAAPTVH